MFNVSPVHCFVHISHGNILAFHGMQYIIGTFTRTDAVHQIIVGHDKYPPDIEYNMFIYMQLLYVLPLGLTQCTRLLWGMTSIPPDIEHNYSHICSYYRYLTQCIRLLWGMTSTPPPTLTMFTYMQYVIIGTTIRTNTVHLIIVGHDQYPPDIEHILHQLSMLGRARSTTVDAIIEYVPRTEEQPVTNNKERLTKLHRVVPWRLLKELAEPFISVVNIFLVNFYAVVYAVGSNQKSSHRREISSSTSNVEKGNTCKTDEVK